MENKKCNKCNVIYEVSNFYKRGKRKSGDITYTCWCKQCWSAHYKNYVTNNLDTRNKYLKKYKQTDKYKNSVLKNNLKRKDKIKEYYELNKKRIWFDKYYFKYRNDSTFRLKVRMSNNVRSFLQKGKNWGSWHKLVGYSLLTLKSHLENLFLPGMSWDNFKRGGWSIDHIQPLSSFRYVRHQDNEFKNAWKLQNLRPLWEKDNLLKNSIWQGKKRKFQFVNVPYIFSFTENIKLISKGILYQ